MKHVFEGIKVADFTWAATGPITTRYLADHGAEVIHIESATRPDVLRLSAPFKDNVSGLNRAPYFADYNAGKYGISLNLNHPRGREVATRLIAWADVVAENFAPGLMERWGMGYEDLVKTKPEIIMIRMSQQGQTGPHRSHPGYGVQLAAFTGFSHLTGWPDREPSAPYGAYTDIVSPRFAIAALVAALDYRRRTGKGLLIDHSQFETSLQFLAPVLMDYTANGRVWDRMGNRSADAAPHGAYPCRGKDRWCVIAVFTDEEWQSLCQVIGYPDWTKDPRLSTLQGRKASEDELDTLVAGWTINYTADQLMSLLQMAGIACGVVRDSEDIHYDPQLKYRHHFWLLEHPEIGKHSYDGPSFKLSKTPAELRMPAPCLGQHNEYIYTKVLGMSDGEFVELLSQGVFE